MKMLATKKRTTLSAMLFALMLPILAACAGAPATTAPTAGPAAPATTAEAAPTAATEATPATAATAAPAATTAPAATAPAASGTAQTSPINDKTLIIGQGQPPNTLFGLESNASAVANVLELRGTTITNLDFDFQAVSIESIPSLENGGAVSETVTINAAEVSAERPIVVAGTVITDTALATGVTVPTQLPQLTVTYKIKQGLFWEDGTAVTSADAAEWWRLVNDPALQVTSRYLQDRTWSFETPDPQTVVFTMAPGYSDFSFATDIATAMTFYPAHLYSSLTATEVRDAENAKPSSFGPYIVQEHVPNETTTWVSHPYANPQPKIGTIIFKYVTTADQLISQFETGEVDMITSLSVQPSDTPKMQELQSAGTGTFQSVPGAVFEHVDFGIERIDGTRPFFDDVRVRQAIAHAINRPQMIERVLFGQAKLVEGYIMPESPAFPSNLPSYNFDPERARQLLDEAGWRVGSDGIREREGRRFEISLATTEGNATRQANAEIIQQSLGDIGIRVNLDFQPSTDKLFLSGAEGTLSGRQFDLAMFAWSTGPNPSHTLYISSEIPTTANGYAGSNYMGYNSPEFDAAANRALTTFDQTARRAADAEAATILVRDVPMLTLYQRNKLTIFKPTVTGVQLNASQNEDTYNVAEWDISE